MTAFYHSVQNLLSSKLMFKTINTTYAELLFGILLYTGVKLGLRGGSNKRLKTLQNEDFRFSSPNNIKLIKVRRERQRSGMSHLWRGGGKRSAYRVLVRKPEGKYWENPSVDGRNKINLKRIQQESGLDWSGSEQSQVAGCCEYGNEPPFSIKGREILDSLGKR